MEHHYSGTRAKFRQKKSELRGGIGFGGVGHMG